MIYTQKLLYRYSFLQRMYVGIRPADAYIAKIQKKDSQDLNRNLLRLKMNESNAVAPSEDTVPIMVLNAVVLSPTVNPR